LKETKKSLLQTIEELEGTMKDTFLACFEKINEAFGKTFTLLFGGGSGMLMLENPDEPLTCGIDIIIKPPGKSVKSISLLSGGEQSFAAIALYLALQSINPAPFCILDEIDSALDEVNLVKFADHIRAVSASTQFIVITHRRGTMERADMIYGILMREKGESDYLKLDIGNLDSNSKFSKGIV
ncbi:MAG: chromosome segregation protein SMC, partial [Clostridia bacterium]|nr:chromosome segregation protein SMC [Clostridia bacterium]